jgi:ribosomal-protein-alanine N-acetyltransferase
LNADANITGAEFSIRDYRPTDFEELWRIDQSCFPPGISYSKVELSSFIGRRHAITLVAGKPGASSEAGDEAITGFAVAHAMRRRFGRILTLDIIPEVRRLGLGSKLMFACEDRLRALGCSAVYLETAVNNEPALRLYRKLGYEVLGVLPEYYASHALDAFQMGKRL